MAQKAGQQSIALSNPIGIVSCAAVGGRKEGQGPLKHCFDILSEDSYFGQSSWEKAESEMLRRCMGRCIDKAPVPGIKPECIVGGDLLNQCMSSAFAVKDSSLPYFGLYGACSTMAEGIALAALLVDSGAYNCTMAFTGSHFCTAERQYRFPMEYGGQRTPSAQWTVTGAGAAMLAKSSDIKISYITPGQIMDAGICDAGNMGAAMAPAAYDTITKHFNDTGRDFSYYDAVFTGDLGALGHDILQDLLQKDGVKPGVKYMDCGVLIYDLRAQDVHAGGSGCGCGAAVLCGHIIPAMKKGIWKKVLFAATGALMSPLSCQQGCSIPGICHAIALETEG